MKEESKRALEAIGVDLDQTLARFVGNEALLMRFLLKFPEDQSFEKLKEAVGAGDAKEAFHWAHTLKGVAGNLGLGRLFELVEPLVEASRAEDMSRVDELFPAMQDAYDEAIATIRAIQA